MELLPKIGQYLCTDGSLAEEVTSRRHGISWKSGGKLPQVIISLGGWVHSEVGHRYALRFTLAFREHRLSIVAPAL